MRHLVICVFFGCVLVSCSEDSESIVEDYIEPSTDITVENASTDSAEVIQFIIKDSCEPGIKFNQYDELGRKQGPWKRSLDGKPYLTCWYQDDLLHGLEVRAWAGEVHEQMYAEGKKHGYRKWYLGKSEPYAISYYENDEFVWNAFPWELENFLIPIKGYHTSKDSAYIKVHYESGALMYEGMVVNGEGFSGNEIPSTGLHHAYYESGSAKAIIDYDKQLIQVFDSTETLIFNDAIDKWRGRSLNGYYKRGQHF